MADINYQVVEGLSLFHRSPEGTLPYIEFNGEIIVDSANVIDVLSEQRDLTEAHLKPEQQAVVRAIEVFLESSLNICAAKYRYDHYDEFSKIWPLPILHVPVLRSIFKWLMLRMVSSLISIQY